MLLNIKIENFEGPFDLLLHLIRKNKMDVYDVKIHDITNQYLEYIHTIKQLDLELTSEFIVMASTLLEIKSKMLLPKQSIDTEDEKESEDPRKELVKKLVEYKKFKSAAEFLKKMEKKVGRNFNKKPEIIVRNKEDLKPEEFLKGLTMMKLYNIYSKLMDIYMEKTNRENKFGGKISRDKFKIEDKMKYIIDNINIGQSLAFSNILKKCSYKIEKAVTFVALLELIKIGTVKVVQRENFKEIYVERLEENDKSNYDGHK